MSHGISQFIHHVKNIKFEEPNLNHILEKIISKNDAYFLEGMTELCKLIQDNQGLLCDKQFVSDTLKLSNKLVKKITLMKSSEQGAAALNKVGEIVKRIVLANWHSGHRSLNKVLKTDSLATWKSLINLKTLDEQRKLFIDSDHILYVSPPKKVDGLESFIKQIQSKITEKTSHIQFQGCPIVSREDAEKFLENPFLMQLHLYPTTLQFSDRQEEFRISNHFLLKCPVLETLAIHHPNMKKYSYIDFSNLDFSTFQAINNFFEKPDSLILNEENIGNVTQAAHFLQCSDLLKKCETFLCENIDSIPDLIEWLSSDISIDFQSFRAAAEEKINAMIKKCANFKELIEILKKLTNAQIKSLNLGSLSFLKDEGLEQIIELFPNLERLNLNNCINITDAIGPILKKLEQLKFLNLARCSGITDAIELPHLEKIRMPNCEQEFLLNLVNLFQKKTNVFDSHFTLMELFNHLNEDDNLMRFVAISSKLAFELSKDFLLRKKLTAKSLHSDSESDNIDIQICVKGASYEEMKLNQEALKIRLLKFLDSKLTKQESKKVRIISETHRLRFLFDQLKINLTLGGFRNNENSLHIEVTTLIDFLKKCGSDSKKNIKQNNSQYHISFSSGSYIVINPIIIGYKTITKTGSSD